MAQGSDPKKILFLALMGLVVFTGGLLFLAIVVIFLSALGLLAIV